MKLLQFLSCIALLTSSAIAQRDWKTLYQPQVFQEMPFRVMKPLGVDSRRSYPVIVSLHGAGGRGIDNNKQLRDWNRQLTNPQLRSNFPCYVVAPQANELWNAWHFNRTKALIETLPHVDSDRIYVMGHSMGGHGTYIFIQLHPEYFAAAAPSAGAGRKTTRDFIDAGKIRNIPIWAFHGDNDRLCPYERQRQVFEQVSRLGGNMKLTTWVGDNHGISGKMIPGADNGRIEFSSDRCGKETDYMTWLFSQSREFVDFNQQAAEVQNLIERLSGTSGLDATHQAASYLRKTISSIRELHQVRGALTGFPIGEAKARRGQLKRQAAKLQSQIESDEELVEMIARTIEAGEEERDDMEIEIAELRAELEAMRRKWSADTTTKPSRPPGPTGQLRSGEYSITQTWSQERNYGRSYFVSVPKSKSGRSASFPVLIFLHGNGGSAKNSMRGWQRSRREIASRYVMVFPQGYRESWNIVSERSKADDLGFIESIVRKLAEHTNVSSNDFSVMGSSNGAAMVNQLAIESRLPNIRSYITGVSPLNVWQHDGTHFKAKGDNNNYRKATTPMSGRRLLNISGTNDHLVPYAGGASKVIPAKGGRLAFLHAEQSTYLWAKAMGYRGDRLVRPSRVAGNLTVFSYLDGSVIHYRVSGEGHGATGAIDEATLLEFLEGK